MRWIVLRDEHGSSNQVCETDTIESGPCQYVCGSMSQPSSQPDWFQAAYVCISASVAGTQFANVLTKRSVPLTSFFVILRVSSFIYLNLAVACGMATQLDRSAYTVGWICALHIEYTAAQEFLDEEHVPLEDDPNQVRDDNHYTLGAIGKHNVVIAVLPSGEYGTASAASVAKDLVRSFPNVRIGLMVGIGGGAPSDDNDIRLGDIVVSTAGDGHSGVFQYDFGKTIQERKFQHTRIMDQPPAVLRAAVSGLRSRYERKGHALDTAIEDALAGNKRLRKKYGKPEPSSDLLFKSDYLHQGVNCDKVCAKDTSSLVDRAPRDEDEDDMQIHYGLIASANSLMKDALVRDQLIEDKNVLCFEMEAAGLMNSFPCLVIRGICDYADSHKSKVWQGYAAMAAAAYSKALCLEIKATSIEKERKVLDIVSEG